MSDRPAPYELWQQAGGDRRRYVELMLEHGHLKPACGALLPSGRRCTRRPDHPPDYHEWQRFDCQEPERTPISDQAGGGR